MRSLPRDLVTEFVIPPSDFVLSRALAADVAESFTVPAGAKYVVFSATGDFYANYSATATVPGDVTNGSASELNPTARDVSGVATISIIAQAITIVTASFYV